MSLYKVQTVLGYMSGIFLDSFVVGFDNAVYKVEFFNPSLRRGLVGVFL
jgi:hypothetical protein